MEKATSSSSDTTYLSNRVGAGGETIHSWRALAAIRSTANQTRRDFQLGGMQRVEPQEYGIHDSSDLNVRNTVIAEGWSARHDSILK